MKNISESDWKLFREKLPQWQEAHHKKLCEKYLKILASDNSASERFWNLEKCMDEDKEHADLLEMRMSRTNAYTNILSMLSRELISPDDLMDFSEVLQDTMKFFIDRY